jgi:hypothetical protein
MPRDIRDVSIVLARVTGASDVYLSAVGTWRLIWYDNIKMEFLEVGWGGWDWIDLAQDTDR